MYTYLCRSYTLSPTHTRPRLYEEQGFCQKCHHPYSRGPTHLHARSKCSNWFLNVFKIVSLFHPRTKHLAVAMEYSAWHFAAKAMNWHEFREFVILLDGLFSLCYVLYMRQPRCIITSFAIVLFNLFRDSKCLPQKYEEQLFHSQAYNFGHIVEYFLFVTLFALSPSAHLVSSNFDLCVYICMKLSSELGWMCHQVF